MLDWELKDDPVVENAPVKIEVSVSAEVFLRMIPYPVIVERWPRLWKRVSNGTRGQYDSLGGSKQALNGSFGRKFAEAFTEPEIEKLRTWYHRFYRWHIQEGTPHRIALPNPADLTLLQRAVFFFGTN